jgi:hypothetical protein
VSDGGKVLMESELSAYLGKLNRPAGEQRTSAIAKEDPLIDPFLH